MLTDELIEQLRCKGEGSDLDYKVERFPFANATQEQKSELLKNVLALANAHREGTAYLLMGFRESVPRPAEVVGLSAEGAVDDSRLQQFVNEKLETKLIFRYEERLFAGKQIAVLSIPKQQRPFYLSKNYGRLTKDTVYIRRGSSTDVASPREVSLMGASNVARSLPDLQLEFQTPDNQELPGSFEREFLNFPKSLPDYQPYSGNVYAPAGLINKEYWREAARYYSVRKRAIRVRLVVSNRSGFALSDTKLEVDCHSASGYSAELLRADNIPTRPDTSGLASLAGINPLVQRANQKVSVDNRGPRPIANVVLGTLRPGEIVRAEEDIAIMVSAPGAYSLRVRVFAHEIVSPLFLEHVFDVSGGNVDVDINQLQALLASVPK